MSVPRAVLIACSGLPLCAGSAGAVTVGIDFVGTDQPIQFSDWVTFYEQVGLPLPAVTPFDISSADSPFHSAAADSGLSESEIRTRVVEEVRSIYSNAHSSLALDPSLRLDVEVVPWRVEGAGTYNVIVGSAPDSVPETFFGWAELDASRDGRNVAAVFTDHFGALGRPIDTTEKMVNAIAGVIAHEAAHVLGLEHVDLRTHFLADADTADPTLVYPLMGGGASANWPSGAGLPNDAYLLRREFSSVVGTQPDGLSSVEALLQATGTYVLGDTDGDLLVTAADYQLLNANFGMQYATRLQGDLDGDGFVTAADYQFINANLSAAEPLRATPAIIPEPASLTLAVIAAIFMRRRRATR